jgi:DNA-binding NtrC family response regulator
MARVMVCDDDEATANELVAAIRAAGHEATTCHHTMDVLRGAVGGSFDLVVIGLDMAGFGRAGAIETLRELAPNVALIALHKRPAEIMHVAALGGVAAVLPRPVSTTTFMYAMTRALEQEQILGALHSQREATLDSEVR